MIKFNNIVEELGHNIAFVLDRENVRYTSEDADSGTINLAIFEQTEHNKISILISKSHVIMTVGENVCIINKVDFSSLEIV